MHREPKITLNHEPKRNKTTMLDLQIHKAQCLSDLEQLTKDGKHIAYYDGIIDASIATGAPRELIGKVCHGRKKTAGGYRWKFKEQ